MRFLIVGFAFAIAVAASGAEKGPRPWGDTYRVILWCGDRAMESRAHTNALARACRELGVTTLMARPGDDPAPWLGSGFDYYVENIVRDGLCLKFRSSVTDWDAFVTKWTKEGRGHEAFVRDYCLSDPKWRESARESMRKSAARHAPFAPVLCDIRDELSTTISANPFDYDFSPTSLAAFRVWLQKRYASLDALNAAWLTKFPTWDDVRPFSTDEIKTRMGGRVDAQGQQPNWGNIRATSFSPEALRAAPQRWHLAPWCDFRTFMDDVLAETLDDLRMASHAVDPATPVGIEGTQMPSAWGGYDLWKLARVLDWVEPYDITGSRAILGSFMPGKPQLATYGESNPVAVSRRMWHLLLEGDNGAILWWSEDLLEGTGGDLKLSAKGRAIAPVVRDMQSPLARLVLRSQRLFDPVAVHYSQASIQLAWLFESFGDGVTWHRRFSSYEAKHNRHAALRVELLNLLREAGWSPQFISYEQLADGVLTSRSFHTCVLPDSFALSDKEVTALQTFAGKKGNRLLYTGQPGMFDANGTPRERFPFPTEERTAAQLIASLPPPPAARVTTPDAGVSVYRYKHGNDRFFALEQRQQGQSSEDVTQSVTPDTPGKAVRVTFEYSDPRPLYDWRTGRQVGEKGRAEVDVPFEHPAILGFTENMMP